jgi:tetratricopeptide (TPR) repeat protein
MLAPAGLAGDTLHILASDVLDLTGGMPLYTRFACAEVAEQGADALERLKQQPPAGVREYFGQQLQQLVAEAPSKRVREALGLMLVARGPIAIAEIADALAAPLWDLQTDFTPIRRFMLGEERLTLMHDELAHALAAWFTPTERAALRSRLLGWCRAYAERGWPDDTPDYIVEHYAGHLFDAGDFDALDRLLASPWVALPRRRLGSHAALLRALGQALEVAASRHPAWLEQELRWQLVSALAASISGRVPASAISALARADRLTQAQRHAELMLQPYDRAQSFIALADAFLKREQRADARAALRVALTAVRGIGRDVVPFDILKELSTAMGRLGDRPLLGRALTLARQHPRADMRPDALCGVALGYAVLHDGRADAASVAAEAMKAVLAGGETPADDAETLGRVAEVAAACTDDELVAQVERAGNAWRGELRPDVLAAIALMQQRLGRGGDAERQARRALRAAQGLRDLDSRSQALARCSATFGAHPQLIAFARRAGAAAIDAALALGATEARDGAAGVALDLAVENWAAQATIDELEQRFTELEHWRRTEPGMTAHFVVGFARAGRLDRALSTLEELGEHRRAWTLPEIGRVLVARGEFEQARALLPRLEETYARVELLAALAEGYVSQQRLVPARELAQQAISLSERIAPELWGLAAAFSVAKALSEAGEPDVARRIARGALERFSPLKAYHSAYADLPPAVSALLDTGAYLDAHELAFAVGGFGGYVIDEAPRPEQQARVLLLAARGWRHLRDASRLAEAMRRSAALAAAVDASSESPSCDDVEVLLARSEMLADEGERTAAIEVARKTKEMALRIGPYNDPRVGLLARLIDRLLDLEQPAPAGEVGARILEAIAEYDRVSLWWRRDRAIAAVALAKIGLREQAVAMARALVAELRVDPTLLGGRANGTLPEAIDLLGADAVNDLLALRDDALRLPKPDERAEALSIIAQSLRGVGRDEDALLCARDAFDAARADGNCEAFLLLAQLAPVVARRERGSLLREMYDSYCRIRAFLLPPR